MMKFADELIASMRCETPMMLSTTGFPLQATATTGLLNLQCTTSYMSGTILTDWQRMNRTEMEMSTTPKFASLFCLEVISGSNSGFSCDNNVDSG